MNWRIILWPFSLIYGAVMSVRNLAFNQKWIKSFSYHVPVISVGNLSTGGTGKTPMVEFLLFNLQEYKPAIISRGYGRKTKGLYIAQEDSTAEEIGDEPLQIKRKFPSLPLILSERRVLGINHVLQNKEADVILLDDAYQHRSVLAGMQILLTTYQQPFYKDLILPAGNLRESNSGKRRAQIVVVTKCPQNLGRGDAEEIRQKLKLKPTQKIYFSTIKYGDAVNKSGAALPPDAKVLLLSGIAHPKPFTEYASGNFNVIEKQIYPDHHSFSEQEISAIRKKIKAEKIKVLCTEKDWVRMISRFRTEEKEHLYYLPMEVEMLFNDKGRFLGDIKEFINEQLKTE